MSTETAGTSTIITSTVEHGIRKGRGPSTRRNKACTQHPSPPKLSVTTVASFEFCQRKAFLEANHIQPCSLPHYYALGQTEHELRRKLSIELRFLYEQSLRASAPACPSSSEVVDTIDRVMNCVLEVARATHPLHFIFIREELEGRVQGAILDEEQKRLDALRHLLSSDLEREELLATLFPWRIEHRLESTHLGLKGRVDEIWRSGSSLEPRDFKTGGSGSRSFYEPSYWVQVALYGILAEQQLGHPVSRVGIHYTYDGKITTRPLDEDLRSHAIATLSNARDVSSGDHVPDVLEGRAKCTVCPFETRCHGDEKLTVHVTPARPVTPTRLSGEHATSLEEDIYSEFHKALVKYLRKTRKPSRDAFRSFMKRQRSVLLTKHGGDGEGKTRARRFLKALGKFSMERLSGREHSLLKAYFNGVRVEFQEDPSWFVVVNADGEAIPWVYVGRGSRNDKDHHVPDCCLKSEALLGLPCREAYKFDENGRLAHFPFTPSERARWGSVIVSVRAEKDGSVPEDMGDNLDEKQNDRPQSTSPPPQADEPRYIGFISEGKGRPLKFGRRGDSIHGFVHERCCEEVMKGDYLIGERQKSEGEDGRVLFLRVAEIQSAPRSAATTTKSVSEVETSLVLEPLYQREGDNPPEKVRTSNYNGYALRRGSPDEIADFLGLPTAGWPLGFLEDEKQPVLVNLPFDPKDAIFRSFFVVGAKGKGKTSLVRELVTILPGYSPQPEAPPAVVILDGEPKQPEDEDAPEGASEFNQPRLQRAYSRVADKLGGSQILQPCEMREIKVEKKRSGLQFRFDDINALDIQLLLPPLPEKSGDVLYRLLQNIDSGREGDFESLSEVLTFIHREIRNNNQVDGRIAVAIARALGSPSVDMLHHPLHDAIPVHELAKPGAITVLNVSDLDNQQRKVVALYLLMAFEQLAERRGPQNLLLVLDEAERLFPRKQGGHSGSTTIKRVAARVAEIARRGRRRRFGMVICTQYPSDVDREIVGNCDLRMTFCLAGEDRWVRENLGKDFVGEVKQLDTGRCYVDLRKVTQAKEPVKVRLFRT